MKLEEIKILNEGGAAMAEFGVGKINKGDIPATIKYISKISGIPTKDLHPLGSVGKKPTSGDIDLAVDIHKYDKDVIHKKMMDELNNEGEREAAPNVNSYAVPIQGNKGKVQVDLMFVTNTDWASFSYFSAADSKYKGAIRTILLMSVSAALNEAGQDHFEYNEDGDLIIRAGRTLDMAKGLRRIFQHRPMKKSGEGYLKTMKSLPMDKFKEMFPDIEVKGGDIIIDDPQTVLDILFGGGVKPKDVESYEQVLKLIQTKFSKKDQEKILSLTKGRVKSLGNKMKIPPELSQ